MIIRARRYKVLVMLAILIGLVGGTEAKAQLFKGDKFFEKHDYERALVAYEKAYVNNFSNSYLTRKIANSYRNLGDVETSLVWFKRTLEMDQSNQDDMLYYAEALKTVSKYDESQKWYAYYNTLRPDDYRALSHLKDSEYYNALRADSADFRVVKLEMNTPMPEFGIAKFGDKLLFSSAGVENPGMKTDFGLVENPYMDVYECTANEIGELQGITKLDKEVNSKFHDGPVWYDESNKELYITRNNEKKGKAVLDEQGRVNLKIYRTRLQDGKWSKSEELSLNSNDYSSAHPTLTMDGKTMYFSSNRDGGIGGNDIYMCKRIGDDWSIPVNVGRPINTEGDEMFPSIGQDGKLYFASDGHVGLGAMDIFYSEENDNTWLIPQNLGYPINSNKDDFGYLPDATGKAGYFSSNRGASDVQDDLYRFVERNNIRIRASVYDSNELSGIDDVLMRMEDEDGFMIGHLSKDENGEAYFNLDSKPGKYNVILSGDGVRSDTLSFVVDSNTGSELMIGEIRVEPKDPSGLMANSDVENNVPDESKTTSATTLKATAFERSTGTELSDMTVRLFNSVTGELVATKTTGVFGDVDFVAEPGTSYRMDFDKAEWTKKSITIVAPETPGTLNVNDEHELRFSRQGLVGEKLDINNIYYDFDKSNIRNDAIPELQKVLVILEANPTMNLTINSHTDSRGAASYNQWLSEQRAKSVVKYLVSKGVSSDRLIARGFGESALTNGCDDYIRCGSTAHQDNRRTEFVITGI